jgi:hypothetical protein
MEFGFSCLLTITRRIQKIRRSISVEKAEHRSSASYPAYMGFEWPVFAQPQWSQRCPLLIQLGQQAPRFAIPLHDVERLGETGTISSAGILHPADSMAITFLHIAMICQSQKIRSARGMCRSFGGDR